MEGGMVKWRKFQQTKKFAVKKFAIFRRPRMNISKFESYISYSLHNERLSYLYA